VSIVIFRRERNGNEDKRHTQRGPRDADL
jgi:hypothetical protein